MKYMRLQFKHPPKFVTLDTAKTIQTFLKSSNSFIILFCSILFSVSFSNHISDGCRIYSRRIADKHLRITLVLRVRIILAKLLWPSTSISNVINPAAPLCLVFSYGFISFASFLSLMKINENHLAVHFSFHTISLWSISGKTSLLRVTCCSH